MRALKILIVDDDVDNANSLGELFEYEGHEAKVVYSGAQAIHSYLSEDFDLGFIDVMMPGMNGIESFMEIRKLKPKAKVFMMSAFSVEDLLKQAITGGLSKLLMRPLQGRAIAQILEDLRPHGLAVTPYMAAQQLDALREEAVVCGLDCRIANSTAAVERGGFSSDLLILNLNMPVVDALGTYATLHKVHELPPTVLVAPASANAGPEEALRDMLVTGILNKPFDVERVLSHVKRLAA